MLSGPTLGQVIDSTTQPVNLDWLHTLTFQLCQVRQLQDKFPVVLPDAVCLFTYV